MKERVNLREEVSKRQTSIYYIEGAFLHILALVIGFITCRARVLYGASPFGIAFVAGCDVNLLFSVSIGVFLGYFIPGIDGGFRYLTALFAVLAVRIILSYYKKLANNPFLLAFTAMLCSIFTSLLVIFRLKQYALRSFAEALLIFCVSFFLSKATRGFKHCLAGLTGEEMTSFLIVISVILISLSSITFYGISLGRIFGILLILISAKYGGTLSGAVSGIAVTFAELLSQASANGFVLFSFGGLLAGAFSPFTRFAQIAAIGVCGIIEVSLAEGTKTGAIITVEIMLGSALFLVMPSRLSVFFGKLFSCCPKVGAPMGIKKGIVMRLNKASYALDDVSKTVEQVSKKLSSINAPSFSGVAEMVEKDTCVGCRLRLHCWEYNRTETLNALVEITKAIRTGSPKPESAADEDFKIRCLRLEKLGESLSERYNAYSKGVNAEGRMEEIRQVVSDQFGGMSDMLKIMAREFEGDDRFDNAAALSASAAIKNLDIRPKEASAKIDRFGRMTLEFKIKKEENAVYNKMQIMRLLSLCCERDFDIPTISEASGEVFLTISERARFVVDIGVCQSSAVEGAICGDAYRYFYDGQGRFFMILSDGMGTGGRAAVDSTFVSGILGQLLKAGFSYDCSLKILNSSMLFKSTDESMATVDIVSIDLFSGKSELLKAGAAPTLVRRSGKAGIAQSNSLPVGILRDVGFDKASIKLKEKDIVLLISDGAMSDGTDWIRNLLEEFTDGSAQKLAETVLQGARRRYKDEKTDDITVMAAIINPKI